jgi:hypothetical protein
MDFRTIMRDESEHNSRVGNLSYVVQSSLVVASTA